MTKFSSILLPIISSQHSMTILDHAVEINHIRRCSLVKAVSPIRDADATMRLCRTLHVAGDSSSSLLSCVGRYARVLAMSILATKPTSRRPKIGYEPIARLVFFHACFIRSNGTDYTARLWLILWVCFSKVSILARTFLSPLLIDWD